jgi:flagellar hook-length control protein FliK
VVDSAAVQRTVSGGIAQIGDAAGVVPASDDTASFDLLALVGAALHGADATGISEAEVPRTENDVPDSEIDGVLAALLAAGRLAEIGVNAVPPQIVPEELDDPVADDESGSEGLDAVLALGEEEPTDAAHSAPETFALAVPPTLAPVPTAPSEDMAEAAETVALEAFIGPPAPKRSGRDEIAAPAAPESAVGDAVPQQIDIPAAPVDTALVAAAEGEPDVHAVPARSATAVAADVEGHDRTPAAPQTLVASAMLPRPQVDAAPSPAPGPLPPVAEDSSEQPNATEVAVAAVVSADEPTASAQAAAAPARAMQPSEAERAETVTETPDQAPAVAAAAVATAVLPQERPVRAERRRIEAAAVASADLPPPSFSAARPETPAIPPGPAFGNDPLARTLVIDAVTGEPDLDREFALRPAPSPESEVVPGTRPDIRSAFSSEIVVPHAVNASTRSAEPLPPTPLHQNAARDKAPQAVDAPASSAPVMNRAAEVLMADLRNRAVERQILSAIRQGRDEARVTLYPPQLGQVVIRLAMDGQRVRVSMRAANEAAEETLQSGEAGLRDALGRQGFELSGFDVDSRNQEEGRRSPQRPYAAPVVAARNETAGPFSIDVTA